jgi:drug/metabolite transporter (DMT)-like permease
MPDRRALLGGSLFALTAASLFATLGPLSRFAAEAGLESTAFVAWRAGIGALTLTALLVVTGGLAGAGASLRALDVRGRAALAVVAAMAFAINVCVFLAFERVSIALALMLFYTDPALVAATGVALGRDRLTPPKAVALGLASVGTIAVLAGALSASDDVAVDAAGVLLGLGAAASQTVFVTVSRSGYAGVRPTVATLVILAFSATATVVLTLLLGGGASLAAPFVSPDPWPYVLVAGILGAALPSVLFVTAIQRIGGTRTGILMLWEPVVGVALAAALLGEPLLPLQVAGGALVVGAALILQLASDPATEPVAGSVDVV